MSVFLCKENVRETLVSQGISLTTSHNTFLYIRYPGILSTNHGGYLFWVAAVVLFLFKVMLIAITSCGTGVEFFQSCGILLLKSKISDSSNRTIPL